MSLKNFFKAIPLVNHSLSYNPSIDGLRGIAVSLVLIFHIWHEVFSFGYVGVDIFFVLSGFLITQIIYQKISHNTFSLKEFYRNRIRRIFPAVIITLVAAAILGYLYMFADELNNLGKHIKSSALFYENIRLMREVGYWDTNAMFKPLLHFWSLAIEEQFYVAWPFLILFLYYLKKRFDIKLTHSMGVLCLILFILPFFLEIDKFYNIFSRAYELAIGGFTFIIIREYKRIVALVSIYKKYIYGFFILSILASWGNTEYNAFKTLLVCLSSSALIIALTRAKQSVFFASAPLVFMGLISFPLYLNHYVLISFCHIIGVDISGANGIIVIIVCVILAYLVYRYIEYYARAQKSYIFAGVLLAAMVLTGLGGVAIQKGKIGATNQNKFIKVVDFEVFRPEYPRFNEGALTPEFIKKYNVPYYDPKKAAYVSMLAANTLDLNESLNIIMGDSHAYFVGVNVALRDLNNKTIVSTVAGCPAAFNKQTDYNECRGFMSEFESALLKSPNIKRLIITNFMRTAIMDGKQEAYAKYLDEVFKILSNKPYPVYYIVDTPSLLFEPKECIKRSLFDDFSIKPSCKLTRADYDKDAKEYKQIVKDISAKYPKINIIDPTDAFCDDKECRVFDGVHPLYGDTNHLTPLGEEILFNEIKKYMEF